MRKKQRVFKSALVQSIMEEMGAVRIPLPLLVDPQVDRGEVTEYLTIGKDGIRKEDQVVLPKDDPRRYGR